MSVQPLQSTRRPPSAAVAIEETFGWRLEKPASGNVLWCKGFIDGQSAGRLAKALGSAGPAKAAAVLGSLNGHFALVLQTPEWTLAAVDPVSSIPLFYAPAGDAWIIDAQARRLAERAGTQEIDPDGALSLAMCGFTIGSRTLYSGVHALAPGGAVVFRAGSEPRRIAYHTYRPWLAGSGEAGDRREELASLTLKGLEKMVAGIGGRPILVPLSAGLDSRLIVSGLKAIGHDDVRCFSYGRAGNYEAEAGRRIAEHLGYKWTFVPYTTAQQRAGFADDTCRAYEEFADSLRSTPFQQDLHAVSTLKQSGFTPPGAVFVNGQTGDFISGGHIPPALFEPAPADMSAADRWERLTQAIAAKHCALWGALVTEANLQRIKTMLRAELEAIGGGLDDPAMDYALAEASEFRNRQAKYVLSGQRIYEFFGYDWRLPLWDRAIVDFWERTPLAAKRGQRLYRDMLEGANWGGVWGGEWRTPQTVRPRALAALRLLAKGACAPLGRKRWRGVERRLFAYPMDTIANYAIAPYLRVASDRRGHRNAISWHTETYLAAKGLTFGGAPIAL
ncbi:MAG: asparagine synthase-related protein [Alphaproteobacteria bacterium]